MKHWRRRLKDGRVEFFFQTDTSSMGGAAHPVVVDDMQGHFEKIAHVTLPPPEWKRPRFKP